MLFRSVSQSRYTITGTTVTGATANATIADADTAGYDATARAGFNAETLQRGAESVRFTLENDAVSIEELMQNLPTENVNYYFNLPFLSVELSNKINEFASKSKANIFIQNDPIGQLVKDGNWFENLEKDFEKLNTIASKTTVPFLTISSGIYQNDS